MDMNEISYLDKLCVLDFCIFSSDLVLDALQSSFFFLNSRFRRTAGGFRFFTLEQFCHFSIAYKKKVSSSFYKTYSFKYIR